MTRGAAPASWKGLQQVNSPCPTAVVSNRVRSHKRFKHDALLSALRRGESLRAHVICFPCGQPGRAATSGAGGEGVDSRRDYPPCFYRAVLCVGEYLRARVLGSLLALDSSRANLFVPGGGFRVRGSGWRVRGSGIGVQGGGFGVQGSGFRLQASGFGVRGAGFGVQGSGFRVQGSWPATAPDHLGTWSERARERAGEGKTGRGGGGQERWRGRDPCQTLCMSHWRTPFLRSTSSSPL